MVDIAAASAIDGGSAFRVGDVLERTLSVLGRNFVPFVILSAIATLPYLYFFWTASAPPPPGANPLKFAGNLFTPLIVGGFLKILTQAVFVYGSFQDMRGQKVSIGASLGVAVKRLLPVVGLLICLGFGVGFASIFLFVPGVILSMMWYVAMPVCVVEGLGPFASLGRSRVLTQGHRWKIFGLVILVSIAGAALGAAAPYLAKMLAGRVGAVIVQYLIQVLVAAFGAILVVVVYRDLRVAKEGIGTDRIAAVFD